MEIRYIKTLLCILVLSANILAQTSKQSENIQANKAAIYIYSQDAPMVLGTLKPTVFMDGQAIAKLRAQKYFIVLVDPGKYSFHFDKRKKSGGIEDNFEAGKKYYLRVGWKSGFTVRPDGFLPVPESVANYDLKQIKPIDLKDIVKKDIVFLEMPK